MKTLFFVLFCPEFGSISPRPGTRQKNIAESQGFLPTTPGRNLAGS
jgi:hypothetical protein